MASIPKVRVRARRNEDPQDKRGGVCLFIFAQEEVGKGLPSYPVQKVDFAKKGYRKGESFGPTLVIPNEEAQALFNCLWEAGLRPPVDQTPKPLVLPPVQMEVDPAKFITFKQAYDNLRETIAAWKR